MTSEYITSVKVNAMRMLVSASAIAMKRKCCYFPEFLDSHRQTLWAQIKLPLEVPSVKDLHCLVLCLHHFKLKITKKADDKIMSAKFK